MASPRALARGTQEGLNYPLLPYRHPAFPHGVLHTPFVIAIRNRNLGDEPLLAWMGRADYRPAEPRLTHPRVYLTEDAEWTLIADDWAYTLFHWCREHRLRDAARWGEVFAFWVGDADRGYGFSHYVNGERRREYIVDSPHFDDRVVVADEGPRLAAESAALHSQEDATVIVWTLAASLGIETDHRNKRLRCYGPMAGAR